MLHPFPWRNGFENQKKKKIENSGLDHYGRSEASKAFSIRLDGGKTRRWCHHPQRYKMIHPKTCWVLDCTRNRQEGQTRNLWKKTAKKRARWKTSVHRHRLPHRNVWRCDRKWTTALCCSYGISSLLLFKNSLGDHKHHGTHSNTDTSET